MSENEQVPYEFDLVPVGPEVWLYDEMAYPYRSIVALKWPGTDELQGYTTTIHDGGLELAAGGRAHGRDGGDLSPMTYTQTQVAWTAPPAYPLPDDAEAYEAPIGPAAGRLVGLAVGAVMWAAIIGATWGIWMIVR